MAYIRRVPKPWLVIEQPMLGEFIVASDEERTQHRIAGKVVARYPTKKAALEVADGMNEDRSENPRTVRGPRRVERPDGYYYQMTGPKRESGPYCSQCGTLKRDGVCPVCRPYDRPLPWDTPCQNSNTKV